MLSLMSGVFPHMFATHGLLWSLLTTSESPSSLHFFSREFTLRRTSIGGSGLKINKDHFVTLRSLGTSLLVISLIVVTLVLVYKEC